MSNGWLSCALGDVITLQRGFDLPIQGRRRGKVPIVSSSGITDYHDEIMIPGPGVVTGRYGTIGEVFFVREDFWPLNTTLWVRDFKGNDPRFVSYLLRTIDFRACSDKSSVPGVNRNDLHRMPVVKPPLRDQRAIARLLGALDDKIALNRQINGTLEAIAHALFKSWFVEFDPVTAKAAGRQPYGMDAERAALFPDRFVETELGPMPEGWNIGSIGDLATNPRRAVRPKEIDPETPYIGLEHMPRRCIALSAWDQAGSVSSGKFRFSSGDILFGKLRPYFHKVGIAPIDGVCSTDVLVVNTKSPHWYGILLGHLSSKEFVDYADAASGGTKMPRTSWQDMARYEVIIPSEPVARLLSDMLRPMMEKIRQNIMESRTLKSLLDALLPELFSGRICLGAAAELVETSPA